MSPGHCSGYAIRTERGLATSGSPIERLNGDCDFSLLSGEHSGTQARTDDPFILADRSLDEATTAVAGRLLPSHPALLGDGANVTVALPLHVTG